MHKLSISNSFESTTLTVKDKECSESLWVFSRKRCDCGLAMFAGHPALLIYNQQPRCMLLILIRLPCIFLLFCAMTNKCTIISQIIILLHISKLSYDPQGTCIQYFAKLHKYFKHNC